MPVLVPAVLVMSAAQLFDLATFATMVRRLGPGAELNPLVGALFDLYGLPMVAIAKVALLAIVSAVAAIIAARAARPRLAAAVVGLGIAIGIAGGLSNAIAIGVI